MGPLRARDGRGRSRNLYHSGAQTLALNLLATWWKGKHGEFGFAYERKMVWDGGILGINLKPGRLPPMVF